MKRHVSSPLFLKSTSRRVIAPTGWDLLEWIVKSKAWEQLEISVSRAHCQTVLNCQSGDMGVFNKPVSRDGSEKSREDLSMAVSGLRRPHHVPLEPLLYEIKRLAHREWITTGATGTQAHETHQALPGNADALSAVHLVVEPDARAIVLRRVRVCREQEEVHVDTDQDSPRDPTFPGWHRCP